MNLRCHASARATKYRIGNTIDGGDTGFFALPITKAAQDVSYERECEKTIITPN